MIHEYTITEKRTMLAALTARMCVSHYWRDHRHVASAFGARELNEHVAGAHKCGLCPIAPGESTTRVALLDMDSHKGEVSFKDMTELAFDLAYMFSRERNHPRLWRSSGGQGIHILLTWAQPQDAYSVRAYLRRALEDCVLTEGTGGVSKGQVEIFPKQDAVPADGCGSMFVLPWAGKSEPL